MSVLSKECIIVDYDGCIADIQHRLHYVKGKNRNYDKFFSEVSGDSPIWPVINTVNALAADEYHILIVSGRSDVCKEDSVEWLKTYRVGYDKIYMRKQGDYRPDYVVKQEILEQILDEGYQPVLAIDDRDTIANKAWRPNGIKTFVCDNWDSVEPKPKRLREPTLHVMVGPSGAGKTQVAIEMFFNPSFGKGAAHISSDDLRLKLLGDMVDQSKNDEIFQAFHHLIKANLEAGLDVVADSTNLRRKDRLAVTALANGGPVVYHVVNRSMEDKIETGGWRNNVPGLMERHEQRFQSQLKDILKGDNLDNVTVEDYRDAISKN